MLCARFVETRNFPGPHGALTPGHALFPSTSFKRLTSKRLRGRKKRPATLLQRQDRNFKKYAARLSTVFSTGPPGTVTRDFLVCLVIISLPASESCREGRVKKDSTAATAV